MRRNLSVFLVCAVSCVPIGAVAAAHASCSSPSTVAHLSLDAMTIDGAASSVPPPSDVLLVRHARDHTLSGVSAGVRVDVVFVDAP